MTAQRPRLFVELAAGMAALSLALEGGRHARPPVPRQGNKRGYARAILAALGLRQGLGAERYLWCEPDAGCRLMLEAYRDPALARAAAEIVRSWEGEDARALWERLRAEGDPVCPPPDAVELARWLVWTAGTTGGVAGGGGFKGLHRHRPAVDGFIPSRSGLARHLDQVTALPAEVVADGRTVDPQEAARVYLAGAWAYRCGDLDSGFNPTGVGPRPATRTDHGSNGRTPSRQAAILEALPAFSTVAMVDDARAVQPPPNLAGVVAYLDPTYQGTTGYAANLTREEVLRILTSWHEAGALVACSEAVGLAAELPGVWHEVDITGARDGQTRTYGPTREVLTLNRPPAWEPSRQARLW